MKEHPIFKSQEGKTKILDVYNKILANFSFDYSEIFVETSYGKTYLLEAGDKSNPPIFLFHGSSTNSAMWFGDIGELSKKYHVFCVDIIGEAGHSEEIRLNLKTKEYALWIDEILQKLKIKKACFMGNSFGGWMSLKYATEFPDKIVKLVLIASSGLVPVKLSFVFKSIFFIMQGEKGLHGLNKMIFGTDDIPDEVIKTSNLIMNNYNPMVGALPMYTAEELQMINSPVMFIAGENDVTLDVAKAAKKLNDNIEKPYINIMKNNGHVIYDTMKEVIPFLDGK